MFKANLIRKIVMITLPFIGVGLLGGCINTTPVKDMSSGYEYHASNGRVYYQAASGRYYFQGKDGNFYYKKYYVKKKNGHYYRYYRYYPDTNNLYINNSKLSVRVRSHLMADPLLKDAMITVRVYKKGGVELLGEVSSPAQKQRAVATALSVPGVYAVDDRLTVQND